LNHAPSGLNVWQGPAVDDLLFVKQLKFQCTKVESYFWNKYVVTGNGDTTAEPSAAASDFQI
jgi:hypothetical protein